MVVQLLRHSFTVDEYHRMAAAGILGEDDRVELVDGEILEMTPIGSRHAACVDRLTYLLVRGLGPRAIVRVQSPVRLSERSEPQPDLTLLRARPDFYTAGHPGPSDILLLVEVAETSVEVDREVKVPLYARAGVPEVWVVSLVEECVDVYRGPGLRGYERIEQVRRGQRVASQAVPDLDLAVEDLLG
jgi:Uma2 family endonuclease